MKYHSAIRKKEILLFWDNMDGAWEHYGSGIRQKKVNTAGSHLYVESKKAKPV